MAYIKGKDKAAILLLYLGEDIASNVLRNLSDQEIHTVGKQMSEIRDVQPPVVEGVINEFSQIMASPPLLNEGGEDFLKKVLLKALGEKKGKSILQMLAMPMFDSFSKADGQISIIESLRSLDPEAVANLVMYEHPQTTALILAHLDAEQVSTVIPFLSEELQSEIVCRMASLDKIPLGAMDEIEDVLRAQLKKVGVGENRGVGGMKPVAEMMNVIDKATGEAIMAKIEEDNPDLAEGIKKMMLVFDDLIHIDGRGIQMMLKEISNEDITMALKTASDDIKDHILQNVSDRAAAMIREDLESLGPVRLGDVEKAQQSIIFVARKLEEEGKIVVGGRGGEDIIV